MGKRLRSKLHSSGGETLVETLTAIVVVVFSSLLLLMSAVVATRFNQSAKRLSQEYQTALSQAELRTAAPRPGTVTVTGQVGSKQEIAVDYYTGDNTLTSYVKEGS